MKKATSKHIKAVIPGSKVPMAYLINYFKEGYSISDFLAACPSIKRNAVEKALDQINRDFSSQYAL